MEADLLVKLQET
jgi:uncharacterized protein (UPF0147 family)